MGADYEKASHSVIGGKGSATVGANLTRYQNPFGGPISAAEIDGRHYMPFDCVITDFFVRSEAPPVGVETFTYTIMLNGAPTALTLVITGAAVTAGPDVDFVAVADGDEISLRIVTSLNATVVTHAMSLEVIR